MRIEKIHFKNLNSLFGEWKIDLTSPAYTSEGLFAITGPTGSGKSTILDAIALALYGATPRLGRMTKEDCEIMSRQTGEYFSEVTFATTSGRYRCKWAQHRAGRRADGNLQSAQHDIYFAESGENIASSLTEVPKIVEEKTGMDFKRFTRSVLLAQGDFAAFLQASSDEKALLLEQMTGTELYADISFRVHERRREESETLKALRERTGYIQVLSKEAEDEKRQAFDVKAKEREQLSKRSASVEAAIQWLGGICRLREQLQAIETEEKQWQAAVRAFKPNEEKLARAQRASQLDVDFVSFKTARERQIELTVSLERIEAELPKLEALSQSKAELLKMREAELKAAKEAQREIQPLLKELRALDYAISEQSAQRSKGERACFEDKAKLDALLKTRGAKETKALQIKNLLAEIETYLKTHARDEVLVSELTGIQAQVEQLSVKQEAIQKHLKGINALVKTLESSVKTLEQAEKMSTSGEKVLTEVQERFRQAEAKLGVLLADKTLSEYRQAKDELLVARTYINKVLSFEEERLKLADDKPCPLCGALDHPYAKGNVPVRDEIDQKLNALQEKIDAIEQQELELKQVERDVQKARDAFNEAKYRLEKAKESQARNAKEHDNLVQALEDLEVDFGQHKQRLWDKLQPLGIESNDNDAFSQLFDRLKKRQVRWLDYQNNKAEMARSLNEIEKELAAVNASFESLSEAFAEKQTSLESLKAVLDFNEKERREKFGDRDPDVVERAKQKAIEQAEMGEKEAWNNVAEVSKKLSNEKTLINDLKQRLKDSVPKVKVLEKVFLEHLERLDFADEAEFIAARLDKEERSRLEKEGQKLSDKRVDLEGRKKDCEARLEAEKGKALSDEPLEELEVRSEAYQSQMAQVIDDIAIINAALKQNAEGKKALKDIQEEIQAQENECRRWGNLHDLIGSSDGKKYRNFAQGLNFEIMIAHANQQLQKMSDRYLLIRDDDVALELSVVDNYQAGEVRPTKNLSGGESFIVSLALALGLSQMASKNVQVNSLFLDEGFGTLDEESLSMSLETLSSLQQDDRVIGIISHVPALKERVSTQINIERGPNGCSTLSGPGCESVGGR